jgi:uncharacterized protein (TIGR03032 family)
VIGPENTIFELDASRQFTGWLAAQNTSLAFSTYRAGKLFLVGLKPDGSLSIFERSMERCMGLYASGNSLWVSTLYQLWRLENVLESGQNQEGFDRVYLPQVGYVTGDLDIHDIATDADNNILFANTLFSCLATTNTTHSFAEVWRPPFISKLAAEDRCHLNGLAMDDGKPKYMTAISNSDGVDGWRDRRADGGVVIDVEKNEIIATGLSMPHSPRIHNGKLWVLNSGLGYLGTINTEDGVFEPVTFLPGYGRGLAFVGDQYAVVGLSLPRNSKTFSGLPLEDNLTSRNMDARCGLVIINLKSGDIVDWLRIESNVVDELYDVVALPGVRRPSAIGFQSDEIRRVLRVDG